MTENVRPEASQRLRRHAALKSVNEAQLYPYFLPTASLDAGVPVFSHLPSDTGKDRADAHGTKYEKKEKPQSHWTAKQ